MTAKLVIRNLENYLSQQKRLCGSLPQIFLQFVIVVFPDLTHILFLVLIALSTNKDTPIKARMDLKLGSQLFLLQ